MGREIRSHRRGGAGGGGGLGCLVLLYLLQVIITAILTQLIYDRLETYASTYLWLGRSYSSLSLLRILLRVTKLT